MKQLITLILLLCISVQSFSQDLYDINTIQTIEIEFAESNWDALLDAEKAGDNNYTEATSVTINGTTFYSVGVKYKGNSSYDANQTKNPFHIELDTYVDQDYQGYKDIKLANVMFDPSFVRETVAYNIINQYMDAPQANYANVYVNGTLIGLYTNTEAITKTFVDKYFYSKDNAFFSCSPPDGAGPETTTLPNLEYLGTNSASYEDAYEIKSDDDTDPTIAEAHWNDLIELTNILDSDIENIESVLDVDMAIWMLALDNVLVNLDSYIGEFKQNYYIYKDDNDQFNSIIWDLNMSFGVFSMTGETSSGPGGGPGGPGGPGGQSGTLTSTTQKAQLDHLLHEDDANFPLLSKLMEVPKYKRMYLAHYKTILTENISNSNYLTLANDYQDIIATAVAADTNKFYTDAQFTGNIDTDYSVGSNTAPGLTNLMAARSSYLLTETDFTNTQPTISSVTPSDSAPLIGDTITITGSVTDTNTDAVYLGYRTDETMPFTKVLMYDDGAHNDGVSGDDNYGVDVIIDTDYMQYYIYAENNNIGAFSPARAEYEFYTIEATYETLTVGDLVINEIMASNVTTVTDQDGEYDDWLELYNNSDETLSLDNLYLSDDPEDLLAWQFPSGLTIEPDSYLIVWCDKDEDQDGLHADIKFSSGGESAILSYADGTVIEDITFGSQTDDMGYARVPNGTGEFVIQEPTYAANNETVDTDYTTLNSGDLVINEIMASNETTVTDQDGEYDDWLELYNNSDETLSLDNLYLSDDPEDLLAWQFPTGLTIAPDSYLIVWCDKDEDQEGLHADIKFSSGGESAILSYTDGTIIENITFGAQEDDMGYARVPNGTGDFVIQLPTYAANNESLSVNEIDFSNHLQYYPNPTDNVVTIANTSYTIETIQVYNMQGQLLLQDKNINDSNIVIDFSSFSNGMYLVHVNNSSVLKIIRN
ncbi:CotH kinase family protein [Lacinutrix sp. C3R15]|uniref:CotH kinase family protein n=1 Tax=Flavobacteriaceae TaxID=49546 RepID=UPI001C08CC24|nr:MULTISPECIES: CotH kinase family protein [Flavobacteriaceae]MBU2938901.1 CotH kinase family protein [Lacinutrix sp. C3R15]MDO6622214.1 CotH kinase family protein [Oceanihabitans sp. 1_MG-2023]